MEVLIAAIVAALTKEEIALLPEEMQLLSAGFAALVKWVESVGQTAPVSLATEAQAIVTGIVTSHAFANRDTEHDDAIDAVTTFAAGAGISATAAQIGALVDPLLVAAHAAASPT